ncbi:ankyrin repeat-containing domain protein [Xylariaceae sp. AK1471]|nr:ankyrin repeat-containing domain protein [Xylariaceae sp. AK1471]
MAVGASKAPLVQFLLESSADPNANLRGKTYSPRELAAVVNAELDVMFALARCHFRGRGAMLVAAHDGRVDMLYQLAASSASVSEAPDNEDVYDNARQQVDWGTLICSVAGNNQVDTIKWLSKGAIPATKNYVGLTTKEVAD